MTHTSKFYCYAKHVLYNKQWHLHFVTHHIYFYCMLIGWHIHGVDHDTMETCRVNKRFRMLPSWCVCFAIFLIVIALCLWWSIFHHIGPVCQEQIWSAPLSISFKSKCHDVPRNSLFIYIIGLCARILELFNYSKIYWIKCGWKSDNCAS